MKASEMRQNKATREWVIYAPSRRMRPSDFAGKGEERGEIPEFDPHCPFCPGNESRLPDLISETCGPEGKWCTRVVPNKYPAVVPNGGMPREQQGIYLRVHGYGHHEVIIESPKHDRQPGKMSREELSTVVEAYHKRYVELLNQNDNMMIIIFRNHGRKAGTSLIHPHSQLIATGMVPSHIRRREKESERYFDEWGKCVYCDIIDFEREEGHRVVFENASFTAFVPYAADVPFETWIMPRDHKADFGDITDEEKSDLADALGTVLSRLHDKLGAPDYNYVINTSAQYRAHEPQLHWYVQILPRLTTMAGFEIGSGMSINPSVPESDAEFLKG